jgi:DNA-binding protein H-NS
MIQSGHLKKMEHLTPEKLSAIAETVVGKLDVDQARKEVEPFVKDPETLAVWSRDFFRDIIRRIVLV